MVLVCVVVAVGASAAYSLTAKKQYTATSALLFNNNPLSQQVAGLQALPATNAQSQQDTNVAILKLGDLAQKTAAQVRHGLTPNAVANSISITPQGDTTVVDVSSTLPSAHLAARVANVYSQTFVAEQNQLNHQYYSSALATVERQLAALPPDQRLGPQALALENRAQSLATLAQLQSGIAGVEQIAAVPKAPSAPQTKRNVAIAAILGLVLGLALAFGVERADQRIREPEELEGLYGLPLLGVVPDTSALRRDSRAPLPRGDAAAAFQFIRAHLRYFNVDRDIKTLLIVSDTPGDGKTTVAHRLAEATASLCARVALIEADLRRPTLASRLGLEAGPGLADVLIGAILLEQATQTVSLADGQAGTDPANRLDVVVAGAVAPNPAEMLDSRAMEAAIARARMRYDLVLIDTPPLSVVSDALPLLLKVDGVVIVSRVGKNRRDAARNLRNRLLAVGAPTLGVVANRTRRRGRPGYGGYGGDYYRSAPAAPGAEEQAPTTRPSAVTAGAAAVAAEAAPVPAEAPPEETEAAALPAEGAPGEDGDASSRLSELLGSFAPERSLRNDD